FSEATPFPGIAAAVPTLGTVLIILFASPKTIVGGVLSWRPFVGIGLISYSAYLWHFPIFAFARYRLLDPPPDWSMAVLSVLTLALAYLSWRFVEQPFRRPGAFDRRRIFVFSGMSAVTLAALGAFFVWSEGFPARMPNLVGGYNVAETLGLRITPHDPLTPHRSGEKEVGGFQTFSADGSTGGKRVLIIGDSHANHLVGFAAHIVAEQGAAVTINWYPGCPPIFGTYKVYNVETGMTARAERCQQQVEDWETYIQEKHDDFDYVILSSRWNWLLNDSAYAGIKIRRDALLVRGTRPGDIAEMTAASPHILQQGLSRTVAKLNGLGLPVILFTQPPLLTRHAGTCNFHLHPTCGLPPYDAVMERQAAMDAVVEGSGVFGPEAQNVEVRLVDYLCDHAKQRCQTFEGEKLYYRDRNHLSTTGSVMVGQAFLQNHPDWFAPPFGQ
ncbi:MAG: acyltransferase family protein, partial [Pseudomonadota bacterium]